MLKKRNKFFLKKSIKTPLMVFAYRFISSKQFFLCKRIGFMQANNILSSLNILYNFIIFLKKNKGQVLLTLSFYKIRQKNAILFQNNFIFRRKLFKVFLKKKFFEKTNFFFNLELFFFNLL